MYMTMAPYYLRTASSASAFTLRSHSNIARTFSSCNFCSSCVRITTFTLSCLVQVNSSIRWIARPTDQSLCGSTPISCSRSCSLRSPYVQLLISISSNRSEALSTIQNCTQLALSLVIPSACLSPRKCSGTPNMATQ